MDARGVGRGRLAPAQLPVTPKDALGWFTSCGYSVNGGRKVRRVPVEK